MNRNDPWREAEVEVRRLIKAQLLLEENASLFRSIHATQILEQFMPKPKEKKRGGNYKQNKSI